MTDEEAIITLNVAAAALDRAAEHAATIDHTVSANIRAAALACALAADDLQGLALEAGQC
jgi:hypothetical protein